MKRTITVAALMLLSLSHASRVFGQDPLHGTVRRVPDTDANDKEDDDRANIVVKKKKPKPHAAFGIEAGPSMSYLTASGGATNAPILGWRFGGFVYIPLAGKLYLQPGLYYVQNGGMQSEYSNFSYGTVNENTTTFTVHAIELPVNIGFRYGHRRSKYKTFIGVGGYVARNIGGTIANTSYSTQNLNIGTEPGYDIKPFDFGLGLNTSTEWRCGLFLRARVQCGLSNLSPGLGNMTAISYGIQVGYLFGKKPPQHKKHFSRMTRDNDRYNDPGQRIPDSAE